MALLSVHPVLALPLSPKRRFSVAFTLVEVLVVLGIIGILAAISVPAVVGLSKASRGTSGISLVMSTVDRARNTAIANATTAYLVIATADQDWPAEYRGRAFAVFTENYNPAADQYTRQLDGRWETLPTGVGFRPDANSPIPKDKFLFNPTDSLLPVNVIEFGPTGTIENIPLDSVRKAYITVFDGTFDSEGAPRNSNPAGEAADYKVRLSLLTGRGLREDALDKNTP
jgi:prepilin-type N-terminal cleavage/methylation domain-containing protein